jgi:peroxiredoxin
MKPEHAPELAVSQWLNTEKSMISLAQLRGSVVVIEAFQMLCPGCVSHGLPQASAVHEHFSQDQVAVIGLHSVFEHHDAMTPISLQAFLFEYRIPFPVGVDKPGTGAMPMTMAAYGMRGTPTLILIDRQGRQRAQYFGHVPDMRVGADIATLLAEPQDAGIDVSMERCDESGCEVAVGS